MVHLKNHESEINYLGKKIGDLSDKLDELIAQERELGSGDGDDDDDESQINSRKSSTEKSEADKSGQKQNETELKEPDDTSDKNELQSLLDKSKSVTNDSQ
jgi:hypothetical protein